MLGNLGNGLQSKPTSVYTRLMCLFTTLNASTNIDKHGDKIKHLAAIMQRNKLRMYNPNSRPKLQVSEYKTSLKQKTEF